MPKNPYLKLFRAAHTTPSLLGTPFRRRFEPRAELLHLQKTYPSRNGQPAMPGQILPKLVMQTTSQQPLPPVAADQLIELSFTRGPRPTLQSTCHVNHLRQLSTANSRWYQTPHRCQPDCPRLVHSARRCSGLSTRQGRWLCRQRRQPNHLSETVATVRAALSSTPIL